MAPVGLPAAQAEHRTVMAPWPATAALVDQVSSFRMQFLSPPRSAPPALFRSGMALAHHTLDIPAVREPAVHLLAGHGAALPGGSLSLETNRPAALPEFGLSAEWEPEPETPPAAGFSTGRSPAIPSPTLGPMEPVYVAKALSVNPVWLPALFAVAKPTAGPRAGAWFNPGGLLPAPGGPADFWMADGPGFSGLLAWPAPSAVYWNFRETWMPTKEVDPDPEPIRSQMPSNDSPWSALIRYWRAAPSVVRGLAMALPLLVPAMFLGPKLASQAPTSRWDSFRGAVRARSTVDLQDDFREGLAAWTGIEGWAATWSFDPAGSARPGRLALFHDSIPLEDYRLEFLGQIETKAMGFVFRAMDTDNYYAAKLVMVKSGPLPTLALVRYSVIDGKEGPRTQTPLIMTVRADTLYRVLVTVQGDHFSVDVNGQYAGSWSDARLKSGGVGFFNEKGDVSRLVWVHVVDKQDFLGWICSQVSLWTADRQTSGVKHE